MFYDLAMALMIWVIPVGLGVWLSVGAWVATENWDLRLSAAIRSLPIAFTVTPASFDRLIPVPQSMFVLFGWIPSDVKTQDYLRAYIPIGIGWAILIPIIFLIGFYIKKRSTKNGHEPNSTLHTDAKLRP